MNTEVLFIANQLQDAYEGAPWFGRSVRELLHEVPEEIAVQQEEGSHSILELTWHMLTWREFTIAMLEKNEATALQWFEENDWRVLDHTDGRLWQEGLNALDAAQEKLVQLIRSIDDNVLDTGVKGRKYNFRKLLHGLIQHDIYHAGQIAYAYKRLQ